MYIVNAQLSCVLKCFLFCAKRGFLVMTSILLVLLVFYQLHIRGTRLTVNLNNLLLTYYRHKRLTDLREGRSLFGVISQTTIKHFTEVRGAEITMLASKVLRCVLKGRKKEGLTVTVVIAETLCSQRTAMGPRIKTVPL